LEAALVLLPSHRGALEALEEIAERAHDLGLLRAALERRLAAAPSASERARVLVRLALLAEGDAGRAVEALTLFGRALDEDAPAGGAALARAGLRRVAARLGKDLDLLRGLSLE